MDIIKMRPHHLMCVLFYEGKGYSSQFCDTMYRLERKLSDNPKVQLIRTGDLLCENCPEWSGKQCREQEKVFRYDQAVCDICQIDENTQMYWEDLLKLVQNNIIARNKRKEICGNCQWNDICSGQEQVL